MIVVPLSCMLSESSEQNSNPIVHFWCVSSITTTVWKKLLHYCLQQDFGIAGRNGKCGCVCSLSQLTFHLFHLVKDSSPGVLICLVFFSIVVCLGRAQVYCKSTKLFLHISHQMSMLLSCSRHCEKGKMQVNDFLPKSQVVCSWVYQSTNVATTSKWRNYMPCMEAYVEDLLSWDPAEGTQVICLVLLSSFDSPSARGLVFLPSCPFHGAWVPFLNSYNLKGWPSTIPHLSN